MTALDAQAARAAFHAPKGRYFLSHSVGLMPRAALVCAALSAACLWSRGLPVTGAVDWR